MLLTGTLTSMRVHYASHEDAQLIRGMNRLRHAYVDIDPGHRAPYLIAGHTDDGEGIGQTYTMGPDRERHPAARERRHRSSPASPSLIAGGWVGILLSPAGTGLSR